MSEILIFIVIAIVIVILNAASWSKSSSVKGRLLDGLGSVAQSTGNIVNAVGEELSANSLQSEINKIDLGVDFHSRYQRQGNVIFITSRLKFELIKESDLTELKKNELLENGNNNDANLLESIENNILFYEKCKDLRIDIVNVSGCNIYFSDSTNYLKNSRVLKVFKVENYGLTEIIR